MYKSGGILVLCLFFAVTVSAGLHKNKTSDSFTPLEQIKDYFSCVESSAFLEYEMLSHVLENNSFPDLRYFNFAPDSLIAGPFLSCCRRNRPERRVGQTYSSSIAEISYRVERNSLTYDTNTQTRELVEVILAELRNGSIPESGRDGSIVTLEGDVIYNELLWPIVVYDASVITRDSREWVSFQRECEWGRKLWSYDFFSELYCAFGGDFNTNDPEPTCQVFSRYDKSLMDLLVPSDKSSKYIGIKPELLLGYVYNLLGGILSLNRDHGAVHICLFPSLIDVVEDDSAESQSHVLIGCLDAIFPQGTQVNDIDCPETFLPPEIIFGEDEEPRYEASLSVSMWQLAIILGMMADIDFFYQFYCGSLPDALEGPDNINMKEFSRSLQKKVTTNIHAYGVHNLYASSLGHLKAESCFYSLDNISTNGILLIMAAYLLHPDASQRPGLADVVTFLRQFSDMEPRFLELAL
ncbi:hypothetical protein [Spongorhabdus nitratireducens]